MRKLSALRRRESNLIGFDQDWDCLDAVPGKNLAGCNKLRERLQLASMNISIDFMAAACRGDLLNIDLLQRRGSPFFPGLTAALDHFLHMQTPPW